MEKTQNTYKSDIEIAQSAEMKPISEIAQSAGIDEQYLEYYGKFGFICRSARIKHLPRWCL